MKIARFMGDAWKPLVLLLLIDCASEPPQNSGVKPFPTPPSQQFGMLFVYIDRHDAEKASPTLYIDGEAVVKLPKDSYTWCYVKPGARVVRTLWGDEHAGMNVHLDCEFKGGESLFLRYSTKVLEFLPMKNAFGVIDPVRPEFARAQIQIGNSTYRRPKKDTY